MKLPKALYERIVCWMADADDSALLVESVKCAEPTPADAELAAEVDLKERSFEIMYELHELHHKEVEA